MPFARLNPENADLKRTIGAFSSMLASVQAFPGSEQAFETFVKSLAEESFGIGVARARLSLGTASRSSQAVVEIYTAVSTSSVPMGTQTDHAPRCHDRVEAIVLYLRTDVDRSRIPTAIE